MIDDNNEIICNCNMLIEFMNNMEIATDILTDDEYDNMDVMIKHIKYILVMISRSVYWSFIFFY